MSLNEQLFEPNVIVVGVFGSTNKVSERDIPDNSITLILQDVGRMPDKGLSPTERNSSIYIDNWTEALHIKSQTFQADWITNGKIAQIIRDDSIAKECTHALVFLGQKSTRLEKFAEKLCKKGKTVFTSSHNQMLSQFEMSRCEPSHPSKALTRARKSSKGKEQTLLKFQKKEEC